MHTKTCPDLKKKMQQKQSVPWLLASGISLWFGLNHCPHERMVAGTSLGANLQAGTSQSRFKRLRPFNPRHIHPLRFWFIHEKQTNTQMCTAVNVLQVFATCLALAGDTPSETT